MPRYLVTGAAGFIGSNFVDHLLARPQGEHVVGLDCLSYAGRMENLAAALTHDAFTFVEGDINDTSLVAALLEEHDIGIIVHFAAESHVDRSISGPAPFIHANINGTHALLEAARAAWRAGDGRWREGCRFHHVSTDEVYGSLGEDDPAFSESTPYAPNSPYAASKAASDHLVRAWAHTFDLPVTISNCSNNYGPRQYPEKLLPLTILNAVHGKRLPIYGKGTNIRDWLHVDDHCRGIDLILTKGRPGETYNIGTGNEWRNVDLVNLLCGLIDDLFAARGDLKERYPRAPAAHGQKTKDLIAFVSDRPGHDLRYGINAEKIRALGYGARHPFKAGLKASVAWYLDNQDWWAPLLAD